MIFVAISAALLAIALVVFALCGRDVVIRVLAVERERLQAVDQDAVRRDVAKLRAEHVGLDQRVTGLSTELQQARRDLFGGQRR